MHTGTSTELATMSFMVINSTLGQMCVSFTDGINIGVIDEDQTFTASLQGPGTSDVQFPSGETATVQVLERESTPIIIIM